MKGLVLAVVALLAAGCSGANGASEPEGTQVTEETPQEASSAPWDDPWPLSTPVTTSGWEITVNEAYASTGAPDPEKPDMGVPEPGTVNVIANIEAVRIGPDPGEVYSFDGGFSLGLMSNSVEIGEMYAVRPADELTNGLVAPGGVITGSLIVAMDVPEDAVAGSVLMVRDHGVGEVGWLEWSGEMR